MFPSFKRLRHPGLSPREDANQAGVRAVRRVSKDLNVQDVRKAPSMAGKGSPEAVRDSGFDDAYDRHFRAAGPPGPGRDKRLRRPDDKMRQGADDERGQHGWHPDCKEERDDWNEPADGRRQRR